MSYQYESGTTPLEEIRESITRIDYASLPLTTPGAPDALPELANSIDVDIDWLIDNLNVVRELVRASRLDMAIMPLGTIHPRFDAMGTLLAKFMGRESGLAMLDATTFEPTERGESCREAVKALTKTIDDRRQKANGALALEMVGKLVSSIDDDLKNDLGDVA